MLISLNTAHTYNFTEVIYITGACHLLMTAHRTDHTSIDLVRHVTRHRGAKPKSRAASRSNEREKTRDLSFFVTAAKVQREIVEANNFEWFRLWKRSGESSAWKGVSAAVSVSFNVFEFF